MIYWTSYTRQWGTILIHYGKSMSEISTLSIIKILLQRKSCWIRRSGREKSWNLLRLFKIYLNQYGCSLTNTESKFGLDRAMRQSGQEKTVPVNQVAVYLGTGCPDDSAPFILRRDIKIPLKKTNNEITI